MPLTFNSPSAVKQRDLDAAAAALEVSFPEDYAAFLLQHNGGVPQPNVLPARGGDVTIEYFYSLHRRPKPDSIARDLVRMTQFFRRDLRLPTALLPIALVDGQDVMVLTLAGKGAGRVSVWGMIESGYDADYVRKVADSFGQVLARLDEPASRKTANRKQQLEALETAVMDGDLPAIRELVRLVDLGKRVPADIVHPVHRAVMGGQPAVLQALHSAGVDLRAEYDGATPVQLAKRELREQKQGIKDCIEFGMPEAAKPIEKRVQLLEQALATLKELGIRK